MSFGRRSSRRRADAEPVEDTPDRAREAALRLLDRSRRTRKDLCDRLKEKGFGEATIEAVVERLVEVGLVDDVEFAHAFLAGRWGRRAAGWRKLEMDLKQKGVSGDDIAAAKARMEERVGGVDEIASARRVIEQSERKFAKLEPRVRKQRLYALLMRRGFGSDVIREALALAEAAST